MQTEASGMTCQGQGVLAGARGKSRRDRPLWLVGHFDARGGAPKMSPKMLPPKKLTLTAGKPKKESGHIFGHIFGARLHEACWRVGSAASWATSSAASLAPSSAQCGGASSARSPAVTSAQRWGHKSGPRVCGSFDEAARGQQVWTFDVARSFLCKRSGWS